MCFDKFSTHREGCVTPSLEPGFKDSIKLTETVQVKVDDVRSDYAPALQYKGYWFDSPNHVNKLM